MNGTKLQVLTDTYYLYISKVIYKCSPESRFPLTPLKGVLQKCDCLTASHKSDYKHGYRDRWPLCINTSLFSMRSWLDAQHIHLGQNTGLYYREIWWLNKKTHTWKLEKCFGTYALYPEGMYLGNFVSTSSSTSSFVPLKCNPRNCKASWKYRRLNTQIL